MLIALQEAVPVDPLGIDGRSVLVVIVVLAILAMAAWAVRTTMSGTRGGRAVAVEAVVSLGERRSLAIVSIEGRRLLLGLTPGSVRLVAELQASFGTTLEATIEKERQA
jgi:flagellar protein FliO/FliZ